ncbi:MAG TPA: sterol desaturase family protein [Opitutaceae bacterium]|nr:sterol desaturase family protein [Opitutaceae bacterium]
MPIYLQYYFWLLLLSVSIFALERLVPRSRTQEVLRPDFVQDLFWMIFNVQYMSWMLAILAVYAVAWLNRAFLHVGLPHPESLRLIASWPPWAQFVTFFLIKDFLEWNIHWANHRYRWLWRFHKLHHSIEVMDWVATFRSHWFEIVIYKVLIYLPLVVLGVDDGVIFWILIFSLLINELNHSNLCWDWGIFRYLLSSPRFHAWHHDVKLHGKYGQNFGATFVLWDWIFRTAHWPSDAAFPTEYGLKDAASYPRGIWARLWEPFFPRYFRKQAAGESRSVRPNV